MKTDAEEIVSFVGELEHKLAGTTRSFWPRHLFRVDSVRAVARILENNTLYSRSRAQARGLMDHDAASPSVIANAPAWLKDYVRLYFRPKTPTEFQSEGFRAKADIKMGAHRPMPIVLVFDSIPILTAMGTAFTNGNAAAGGAKRGETAEFLRSIPFDQVYHEGVVKPSEASITFHRCAEVLIKESMQLQHLKRILCRSGAEYETLKNILSDNALLKFGSKIGVSAKVHYRRWSFVESVDLTQENIKFGFNPSSLSPGPFDAKVTIYDYDGDIAGTWHNKAFSADKSLSLDIRKLNLETYGVVLTLDDSLAMVV